MALYHLSAKVIQRSRGRSAIAAAAYRAAEELEDERLGRRYDYTDKTGVVHSEILLPEGAPGRWLDRAALWNEVEARERRKDAVLAREVEFALPRELSQAEGIGLARDYVREQFVSRGMVADLNVHWDVGADGGAKPHAHVLLTMRAAGPEGFGLKRRDWNDKALLHGWRERWACLANERLAELGYDVRIDPRSYVEQGIDLEPQHKIGPAGVRREARGEDAERAAEHRAIARRNGERIAADPEVALDALTRQHSTFTKHDLARFVSRHSDGADQFRDVLAKVEASPELVRVGVDGHGRERFSTREMLAVEQRMERAAEEIAERAAHRVSPFDSWRAERAVERAGLVLGQEQRDAVRHVTSGRDLAVVVGHAGTGKSALLGVARQAWEAAGFRVRGAALSGIAAEGLEAGSGISARTLASLEWGWREGRERLGPKDVLVVDEAGLVGSRQMERVLSQVRQAGAKVVLVGDPEQLQAIEAGAAFRALAERHGVAEITEVRRQREGWQREATRELATGRTAAALSRYAEAGMVQAHGTREEARAALVAGWEAERREKPEQSRVILAHTRADVAALNRLARERMREAGALGPEYLVATAQGERGFAEGDRVMFLRNERDLGVKNGTLGTLEGVAGEGAAARLSVRLDDGRRVGVAVAEYGHIEHGYAATIHKAQGVTVARAHVLASAHMDRHAAYVALSRHRDGVALHYGRDEFADGATLARTLGREQLKDTSLDYAGPEGLEREVAAYAERRGLHPLAPESAIVVRRETLEPERQAARPAAQVEASAPRRGRFAGLKLNAAPIAPGPVPEGVVPKAAPPRLETPAERLARGLEGYARAWADAARMEEAGLPVLPHQEVALARAGAVLEREGVGLARDAAAALARRPELGAAAAAGRAEAVGELGHAVEIERHGRLALEALGRAAVRAWGELERAYEAAEAAHDWEERRVVGKRMEAFAEELKADRRLEGLLRERGRELGVAEGSRLARVVQAKEAEITRELRHELRLREGRGISLGR